MIILQNYFVFDRLDRSDRHGGDSTRGNHQEFQSSRGDGH